MKIKLITIRSSRCYRYRNEKFKHETEPEHLEQGKGELIAMYVLQYLDWQSYILIGVLAALTG